MGKTSGAVKNRGIAKAYAQLPRRVSKGEKLLLTHMPRLVENQSTDLHVLRETPGISAEAWKAVADDEPGGT